MAEDKSDPAPGATGAAAPAVSETVKRLTEQKERAALRADIAEQQAKLASLGLSAADAPKGTTTISGDVPAEGLTLAYLAVNAAAARIAGLVATRAGAGPVLIHNPADFKAISALNACRFQIELLTDAMTKALAEEKQAAGWPEEHQFNVALPAVGAALTSVLQIAALFRVDQDLKYSKIEIQDRALITAVAGALREKAITVFDTATMPLFATELSTGSKLYQSVKKLDELNTELTAGRAKIAAKISENTPPANQTPDQKRAALELKTVDDKVAAVLAQYDAFDAAMAKFDDATSGTKMMQYLDAERLSALMTDTTCFLWLQIAAASGGSRTVRTFFSAKTSYSGAAVVSYALYDRSSALIKAGTIPLYSGFRPAEESLKTYLPGF